MTFGFIVSAYYKKIKGILHATQQVILREPENWRIVKDCL